MFAPLWCLHRPNRPLPGQRTGQGRREVSLRATARNERQLPQASSRRHVQGTAPHRSPPAVWTEGQAVTNGFAARENSPPNSLRPLLPGPVTQPAVQAGRSRFHRPPANERQARPECSGRAWKAAASFARNDRLVRPQKIVTVKGGEAIPLATTTSVLLPAGVLGARVNLVEDLVPGATDTEVQLLVRA
jgi:hypothetical protein